MKWSQYSHEEITVELQASIVGRYDRQPPRVDLEARRRRPAVALTPAPLRTPPRVLPLIYPWSLPYLNA